MHPLLFHIGPVYAYSYGVLVAAGVLCAIIYLRKSAPEASFHPDTVLDHALVSLFAGFAGARIYYVIQFWEYYKDSPIDVLKMWEGGIVYYGGFIGGVFGFFAFAKLKRLPVLASFDLFMPALALAQSFGRIGCYLNGCCFGRHTHLPWGVKFPFLPALAHPTQIYESVYCLFLFWLLAKLWRKHPPSGTVLASYLLLYPIGRFVIEFFRGDQPKALLNLSLAQWVSVGLAVLSSLLWSFVYKNAKQTHQRSA